MIKQHYVFCPRVCSQNDTVKDPESNMIVRKLVESFRNPLTPSDENIFVARTMLILIGTTLLQQSRDAHPQPSIL